MGRSGLGRLCVGCAPILLVSVLSGVKAADLSQILMLGAMPTTPKIQPGDGSPLPQIGMPTPTRSQPGAGSTFTLTGAPAGLDAGHLSSEPASREMLTAKRCEDAVRSSIMDKVNGVDFSGCLDLGENGDAAVGAFYKVLAGTNAFGTLSTNIYLDFSYTQVPLELVTKWTKICGEDNRVLLLNVANNETITDELITALNFQKIAGLNLANTPITDAGLAKIIQSIQLNGIGPFRYLNLTGSKVTAAGIEALMNAVRAAGQLETPFTLYWNNDTVFRAGGEANEAVTLTSQATAVPAVPSEVAPTPAASLLSLPGIGIGPAEAPTSGVPLSTPSVGSTGSPGETIPPVVPTIPGLTASEEKAALAALSSLDSAPSPAPSSGSTGASLPGALKFLAPVAEALKSPAQSDDAMIQALMSR